MTRSTWKQTERAVAALVGGQRVPVSGRGRGDAPDIAHPRFSYEAKHRASVPAWIVGALDQARAAVRGEQVPVAIIHEHGQRHAGDIVMLRLVDWLAVTGDALSGPLRDASEHDE